MGVGVLVAAFTSTVGVVVWQGERIRNGMDAGFQNIDARFQEAQTERLAQFETILAEISALRSEINAENSAPFTSK